MIKINCKFELFKKMLTGLSCALYLFTCQALSSNGPVWLGVPATDEEDAVTLPQWSGGSYIRVNRNPELIWAYENIEKIDVFMEMDGPSVSLTPTDQGRERLNTIFVLLKRFGKKKVVLVIGERVAIMSEFPKPLKKGEDLGITSLPYEVLEPLRNVPGVFWYMPEDYLRKQGKLHGNK